MGHVPVQHPDDTGNYGGYGVEGLTFPNYGTGAVGHRDLVLDQSMIMAALDNALNNRALQRLSRSYSLSTSSARNSMMTE